MATTLQLLLLAAACALVAAEWSVVGSGWCQDENGAYTSDVQGVVGSGAKGEAKCRAACLARQPRCVAMSFDHSNGYCGLVGRTLTRADTNMALGLTNYWPYSGSDIITRTAVDANDVCTVYTPGEHRRPPARPPTACTPTPRCVGKRLSEVAGLRACVAPRRRRARQRDGLLQQRQALAKPRPRAAMGLCCGRVRGWVAVPGPVRRPVPRLRLPCVLRARLIASCRLGRTAEVLTLMFFSL